MPFARLTLLAPLGSDELDKIGGELTTLIADVLKKKHHLTSILIETVTSGRWTVGAAPRNIAAHLEVCVTEGTNTEEEKRAFVYRASLLLKHFVGDLDKATYVVVHELSASHWGYDGVTQADRALGANLAPPG
jgi:4-oxalocrotonate tautomerase